MARTGRGPPDASRHAEDRCTPERGRIRTSTIPFSARGRPMFHTRRRREMTKWLQPTGGRRHRRRLNGFRPGLEILEDRTVPAIMLSPEVTGGVAGLAGNLVEFRKGPAGFISPADTLASADN